MIADKNEPRDIGIMKLKKQVKKLRKKLFKTFAETLTFRAYLQSSIRQTNSKVASDI